MKWKTHWLVSLVLGLGVASEAPAQIFDGQYWEAGFSGKTRVIVSSPSGNPAESILLSGKLAKEKAYLLSSWDGGSQAYVLDVWTSSGGAWVSAEKAGVMTPFGEGFPDSENALIELTLDLTPTAGLPEGALPGVVVELSGLVSLSAKLGKNVVDLPGVDDVQALETGGPTGGSFVLSFEEGETDPLDFDLTAGELQTALQGLEAIGEGNLLVQGAGASFTLTFAGSLSQQNIALIQVLIDDTTGGTGVTLAQETRGMSPVLRPLKGGSLQLASVGAVMNATSFAGFFNQMLGSPKLKAKRILEGKLPFVP